MAPPCFTIEKTFSGPVAGVDEAGRGPLAGPVVAAAVVLDSMHCPDGIDDSKKLSAQAREALYHRLKEVALIGVGIASVGEIDRHNILRATMLAMVRAVDNLACEPCMVLVDGNRCPDWRYPSKAIVGGDSKSRSIAAASIIAKVTRDRMMEEYDILYPGYGWAANKGYGTPEHCGALDRLGPTPIHRRSFAPVRQHIFDL